MAGQKYKVECPQCGTIIARNQSFDLATMSKNTHNKVKHGAAYDGPAYIVEDR